MNFRQVIKKNQKMTFLVILTYIMIMYCVGIIADIAIHPIVGIGIVENFKQFMMFHNTPYITILIMSITLICIICIHFWGHKWMMMGSEYEEIKEGEQDINKLRALNTLTEMSIAANLGYVPKLYIINTQEMNAFAAGWSKRNSIVGVTVGLLEKLNRAELQAVIAHEVGHIIHNDSKLTMYVGILANVILTVTDIFAHLFFFFGGGSSDSKEARTARLILLLLNFLLPIVTRLLYLFLSRRREYMADAAAVKLTGDTTAMVDALKKISVWNGEEHNETKENHDEPKFNSRSGESFRKASYIFNSDDSWFSTHPSIKSRINLLENNKSKNEKK